LYLLNGQTRLHITANAFFAAFSERRPLPAYRTLSPPSICPAQSSLPLEKKLRFFENIFNLLLIFGFLYDTIKI